MLSARYINISTGRVGEAFPICEECFENVRENLPFQLPTLEIYKLGVHEDAGATCEECEEPFDEVIDAVIIHKVAESAKRR